MLCHLSSVFVSPILFQMSEPVEKVAVKSCKAEEVKMTQLCMKAKQKSEGEINLLGKAALGSINH